MRILFLTNNDNTRGLVHWLRQKGETVLVCPDRVTLELLENVMPDLLLSYNYRFLIKAEILEQMGGSAINLHTSYLPYNRGAYPNIWSILDGTPKGVSIHYLDTGFDTGDVIAQRHLHLPDNLTLRESYDQLQREMQRLFMDIYPYMNQWNQLRCRQKFGGTQHTVADFRQMVQPLISSWDMTGEELLMRYIAQSRFHISEEQAAHNRCPGP